MERIEIIDAVGREYHTSNIENGEFSYPKAFKEKGLDFDPIKKKGGKGEVLPKSWTKVMRQSHFEFCIGQDLTHSIFL